MSRHGARIGLRRYRALATDYDGTLATDGKASGPAIEAIRRLQASGRRAILVTGRQLPDLLQVFPQAAEFDYLILEDGAVACRPGARETTRLADPPPEAFLRRLLELGVGPLDAGEVVVATVRPHHRAALRAIRELRLDLRVIYNRQSVVVLPAGVDKGTGLAYAARRLGLRLRDVAGIGDAENDRPFLARCGLAAAVANALPAVRRLADRVTAGENGRGVSELVDALLAGARPGER
jgi:hydroxymethylpyrimidine pyrophosphatase-like HAD family hydrolase